MIFVRLSVLVYVQREGSREAPLFSFMGQSSPEGFYAQEDEQDAAGCEHKDRHKQRVDEAQDLPVVKVHIEGRYEDIDDKGPVEPAEAEQA